MVCVASAEGNRRLKGVRAPRAVRCDLGSKRVVDRTRWGYRWDSDHSILHWSANRLGAGPPLQSLAPWRCVAATSVDTHDPREGEQFTVLDRWGVGGAVHRAVYRYLADLIGEVDVEEGELVSFEQLHLDFRL